MLRIPQLPGEKGLRTRLILGSIAVAMLVSVISIIVAYRLAVDLGLTAEMNALEARAETLLRQLDNISTETSPETLLQITHLAIADRDDHHGSMLNARVNGREFRYEDTDPELLSTIRALDDYRTNGSGEFSFDGDRFLWAERSVTRNELPVYQGLLGPSRPHARRATL